MTHTLHREGTPEFLGADFVVSIIPSTGRNQIGAAEKIKTFYRLMLKHNPTNFGVKRVGQMYQMPNEEIIEGISGRTHSYSCVLFNRDDLIAFLKDIKEADLGISIVVSGNFRLVEACCLEAGVKPHTINFSMGVWGKTEKLPPKEVREITTGCGHGMVSPNLVISLAKRVKAGRITAKDAAIEIARPCYCGIINVHNVEQQIIRIAESL